MIACKWQSLPCKLAFTNNGWLKYIGEQLTKVVREYVIVNTEIWFLNDVCLTDQGLKSKPFLPLIYVTSQLLKKMMTEINNQ